MAPGTEVRALKAKQMAVFPEVDSLEVNRFFKETQLRKFFPGD
jgi:multidrug resistance efflux pump